LRFSSADSLYNSEIGNITGQASTVTAHFALLASATGGAAEFSGMAMGAAALAGFAAPLDGPFSILADAVGAGTGVLGGYMAGHIFHLAFTDRAEAVASSFSTGFAIISDISSGKTRVDNYKDHTELVIGEQSASSLALTTVGNLTHSGILDAIIDFVGFGVSSGQIHPFDLACVTGKMFQLPHGPALGIRFGD
jgi:hypothetical protein